MTDPIAIRITATFNRCFANSHRTIMCGGGDEPLYQPASATRCARITFNRDYPASALHEAAHWCIADQRRRRIVDYGYAYLPPPRTTTAQRQFLDAEVKNQGLECLFADAVGIRFKPSLDDLRATEAARSQFEGDVRRAAQAWRTRGLGTRASLFLTALEDEFADG